MDDLRLEDQARIDELTTAYAYAVDDGDWVAYESLFVPDAHIDYLSAGGIAGAPGEVTAWMRDSMALFTWSMHSLSTRRIVFTGPDAAAGTMHVMARHGLTWEGADELMDVSAVYHDEFVRTADGWQFASRREETLAVVGGSFAEMVRTTLP